jgi:AraC-like DNA-binding protein
MLTEARRDGLVRPWENGRSFRLEVFAPAPRLSRLIDQHWTVGWDVGPAGQLQEILPHPSINLVVEPSGAFAWGVPRNKRSRLLEGCGWAVGTKLKPGAFTAATGIAASRLTDRHVPLRDAFASAELDGLTTPPRPADLEDILLPYATVEDRGFELVTEIVARMRQLAPHARVEEIARLQSLSVRTLQRLFAHYVGVSPKWVLKRLRVHEAVAALTSSEPPELVRLALDLGYYDQAHFIRDFRAVVGRSPAAYVAEAAAAG